MKECLDVQNVRVNCVVDKTKGELFLLNMSNSRYVSPHFSVSLH